MSQTIAVHVTPKASRSEVVGVRMVDANQCEVVVRVTAPPDAGKANKAVCALVAKQLGTSKTSVVVKRGETSRHKLLEVDASSGTVDAWVNSLASV